MRRRERHGGEEKDKEEGEEEEEEVRGGGGERGKGAVGIGFAGHARIVVFCFFHVQQKQKTV